MNAGRDNGRNTAGADGTPPAWRALARSLGGSFTARARGILAPELSLLDPGGEPFGRLLPRGTEGADLEAGDATARIERTNDAGYRMVSGAAELLTSRSPGSATALGISTPDQTYTIRVALLRNLATAQTPDGDEAVRLSGGLANRRYRATFREEALPVAVFLLYHLVELRSRAFRT